VIAVLQMHEVLTVFQVEGLASYPMFDLLRSAGAGGFPIFLKAVGQIFKDQARSTKEGQRVRRQDREEVQIRYRWLRKEPEYCTKGASPSHCGYQSGLQSFPETLQQGINHSFLLLGTVLIRFLDEIIERILLRFYKAPPMLLSVCKRLNMFKKIPCIF
jgi:hypothetical protein